MGNSTKNILYQMITVIYYRGRNTLESSKSEDKLAKNPADTLSVLEISGGEQQFEAWVLVFLPTVLLE